VGQPSRGTPPRQLTAPAARVLGPEGSKYAPRRRGRGGILSAAIPPLGVAGRYGGERGKGRAGVAFHFPKEGVLRVGRARGRNAVDKGETPERVPILSRLR
jgi:hypothetical protein